MEDIKSHQHLLKSPVFVTKVCLV